VPFITSDGANLFLDVAGSGTPVVFVHGLGLDRRQWDPQWDEFARDTTAVRIDLRAHGRSAAATVAPPAATLARDLERALVQLGIDRLHPGFIVAHGHAAAAAIATAIDEPRAVRGLVLVSPAIGDQWDDDWRTLWRDVEHDAGAGRPAAALARWRADAGFDGVRALPAAWAAIEDMHAGCNGGFWARAAITAPTSVAPESCPVPMLIVSGRHDRADMRAAAAALVAAHPHAELRVADAGHFPNLERPLEFTQWVREFIARHS
jgi:pimeloyl-ACP methyl ester carboxylesterase